MKVLLCHTYYMQRGGEDCCFEEERDLVRSRGHEVIEFVRRNDELMGMNSFSAATATLWNRRIVRELRQVIERERPAVAHFTNTFPLLSPAVCHAARRAGIAVVQALHNYRWLCAGAYMLRDGKPCQDCLNKRVAWPAVRHGCYRGSVTASAVVAGMQLVHRTLGKWMSTVDAFFTITEFAKTRFVAGGFPAERIFVKANSVADPGIGAGAGQYAIFVGRLSPEKGISMLLESWRKDSALPRLVVVGQGPLAGEVQSAAAKDSRISWKGQLPHPEVLQLIGEADFLVMPSLWYETFGRSIVEAFAAGTPAIVSRLGAMAELVAHGRTGWHFEPGDARDLSANVRVAMALSAAERAAMRAAARAEYERRFTTERNYRRLLEIYDAALEHQAARSSSATQTYRQSTGHETIAASSGPIAELVEAASPEAYAL
jgi:glycosyltransferase involved in cell wall biosynthesis